MTRSDVSLSVSDTQPNDSQSERVTQAAARAEGRAKVTDENHRIRNRAQAMEWAQRIETSPEDQVRAAAVYAAYLNDATVPERTQGRSVHD